MEEMSLLPVKGGPVVRGGAKRAQIGAARERMVRRPSCLMSCVMPRVYYLARSSPRFDWATPAALTEKASGGFIERNAVARLQLVLILEVGAGLTRLLKGAP